MVDSDILELEDEVAEFVKETEKINTEFGSIVNNINLEFRSVDSIFSKHHRQKKVYKELLAQLAELEKEDTLIGKQENQTALSEIKTSLTTIKVIVDNLGKSKRKTGSYFVSLIMGKVSVRIWNEGDRYKFKSEYNRFKERWMSMFFIFPVIQILFGFSIMIHQLQSILFFFYYSSLAIRENILSLNGSRIESWWIKHHYWSMAISLLSLIIANQTKHGDQYGIQYLNYFFFYQWIVMILQNRYQRRRHYARKAMAKKSKLDIRTSEVIDETPHEKYKILIPALYTTYFMELMVSIFFLFLSSNETIAADGTAKSLQIIAMSICWFVLSIGNCATLTRVLQKKRNKQKQRKKT